MIEHQAAPKFAFFAAAAIVCGCTGARAPMSPSPDAPTTAAKPIHPSIVGTVLLSSTHEPTRLGGVVFLEDAPKVPGALMSANVVTHHKEFEPFITVLTTGGTANFFNVDPMPHHVFSPDVPGWDTGYLKKDHPVSKTFTTPGPVSLLCNIHPEMLGFVLVIPSTYFGKVDADGKYVIGDVPPGTYKATAWVPRDPTVTKPVTVSPNGVATADFEVQHSGTTP